MADFEGSVADGIARAVLNRPESLNAFSDGMRDQFIAFLLRVERDPAVRCLVLSGAGGNFMAGGDVKSFVESFALPPEDRSAFFEATCQKMNPIIMLLRRLPKPVIASVSGACAGLGVSFVLASDLAIAADDAFFSLAYSRIGTTPDGGATYFLPHAVGMKRAAELAFLSERIDASAAREYGLINRVVPAGALAEETEKLARKLADGATAAIARTKALLIQASGEDLERQLQAEAVNFAASTLSPDMSEGITAFVEKRRPVFGGR
ncbi:enoyl-CoA hydratase/isomerase family protein [Sphingomonas crusticola]|uniref:enoyl-CoA hydratase/isomerase family protein n=1 Tax=Sphingomonas crusticola TaxID=1697973 RepID=UPI000E2777D6|nr:enoyl-CoA hydratase-related protein [Sphingomonas crusticola]